MGSKFDIITQGRLGTLLGNGKDHRGGTEIHTAYWTHPILPYLQINKSNLPFVLFH
jgi:hypothetical protein